MRKIHVAITLALLAVFQLLIWQKEHLLAHGTTLLLQLAPVDPRSLIQGDYMRLRYEIASHIPAEEGAPFRGSIVVHRDANEAASFVRLYRGEALGTGELLLQFHRAGREAQLGAESFFFQEGKGEEFAKAEWGELKVAADGSSVLTGLRDESLQPLGKTAAAAKR